MLSHRPPTPSGQSEVAVQAAHSPVQEFKTPEPGLHLPHLPQPPHLPGQSPKLPGQSPSPNLPALPQLPGQQSPIPALPVGGGKKGLRRRLKLQKLLGAKKLPVSTPVVGNQIKVSKRARLSLLATRVKLRLKGVKTPSTALVTKTVPPEGLGASAAPPSPATLL